VHHVLGFTPKIPPNFYHFPLDILTNILYMFYKWLNVIRVNFGPVCKPVVVNVSRFNRELRELRKSLARQNPVYQLLHCRHKSV
jgi:hypothetical protein